MTMTPVLDRDRLLRDLRAAAEFCIMGESEGLPDPPLDVAAMGRAWQVVAAAIEDGEYDREEAPR